MASDKKVIETTFVYLSFGYLFCFDDFFVVCLKMDVLHQFLTVVSPTPRTSYIFEKSKVSSIKLWIWHKFWVPKTSQHLTPLMAWLKIIPYLCLGGYKWGLTWLSFVLQQFLLKNCWFVEKQGISTSSFTCNHQNLN